MLNYRITSVRERHPKETLKILKSLLIRFGITRVTDTTHLDRIGIPVYAAIRPSAHEGSLCVSSGKSIHKLDAKLGSLVEAAELGAAQLDYNRDNIQTLTIKNFEKQLGANLDVYDFGVNVEVLRRISSHSLIEVVQATDLKSMRKKYVPAALIFCPYKEAIPLFTSSSNGLSGGNSLSESLLHGVLELIERDTASFTNITPIQNVVYDITSTVYDTIIKKIKCAGMKVYITFSENIFRLPMFTCYLFDVSNGSVSVARGQGLHFCKNIALIRALTEAIQSRLTNIHGGRDDIVRRFTYYKKRGLIQEINDIKKLETNIKKATTISFKQIYTNAIENNIEKNLNNLLLLLDKHGFHNIYYYDLTPDINNFKITKSIVPGLEYFDAKKLTIGKRIIYYASKK